VEGEWAWLRDEDEDFPAVVNWTEEQERKELENICEHISCQDQSNCTEVCIVLFSFAFCGQSCDSSSRVAVSLISSPMQTPIK